ncbi:MAG: hypothetical protein K9G44_00665 [Melioribacteraceae bacterium]|nr:hypothetical protein [Melioribacteraceae bacterium]
MKKLYGSSFDYYTTNVLRLLFKRIPCLKKMIHFLWTVPSSIWGWFILRFHKNSELKIVIGSSGRFKKGWIPTNNYFLDILKMSDWERYFTPSSVDFMLAEHVWEHLDMDEAKTAVRNCFLFLKKGGCLRIAVPDGFNPDKDYFEYVKPGGFGPGADDHKILYNYKTLTQLFPPEKFKVKLLEYYDEQGKFVQNDWNAKNGFIYRSAENDSRNSNYKVLYNSIIIDAIKL